MHASLVRRARNAVPLDAVRVEELQAWLGKQDARDAKWLRATHFTAKAGELRLVPSRGNGIGLAALGLGKDRDPLALAAFSESLPEGVYRFRHLPEPYAGANAVLAWVLGTYVFDRYRRRDKRSIKLVLPESVDAAAVNRVAEGVFFARDLINTPSNDMGPAELAEAVSQLAHRHAAKVGVIEGDALLKANYPLIHAVGRASDRAPRLIDVRWGDKRAAKVTLVGKGVCFDSGGLDLKTSAGMLTMKKDMGGAAVVLGLAHMIMEAQLPLRLRVLIPAVENAVSGRAYRPGDVLKSRKGFSIEDRK